MAACVPGGEFFLILMSLWNIIEALREPETHSNDVPVFRLESLFGPTLDVL